MNLRNSKIVSSMVKHEVPMDKYSEQSDNELIDNSEHTESD